MQLFDTHSRISDVNRHTALSSVLCVVTDSRGEVVSGIHSPIQEQCSVQFVDYSNAAYAKEVNEVSFAEFNQFFVL